MAATGYPNHGQMPPMGGPPGMGGPPNMGGPPQQMMRPVRRGTSKAVPVVVSAGLAVGVFCGLLFGVGTGKEAGASAPSASNIKKVDDSEAKVDPGAAPKGLGATSAKPVETAKTGSAAPVAVAGTGSAAPAAAGTTTTTAAAKPAVEEKKTIKVKISLKPDAAAQDAKVTIDGKPIEGLIADLPADTKSFKLEIKSNGYRTFEKKVDTLPGTAELTVEFELTKRPASGTGVRPPKRPDRPTNAGGGGLIDI